MEFFREELGVGGTLEGEYDPDLSKKIYLTKRTAANRTVMICREICMYSGYTTEFSGCIISQKHRHL